jgi:hypothetical protein
METSHSVQGRGRQGTPPAQIHDRQHQKENGTMGRKLFLAVLVAGLLAMVGQAWAYTYSGAWEPTDGDVNILVSDYQSDYDVYIYDYDNTSNYLKVLAQNGAATTIYFHQSGGNWYASLTQNGTDLNLGTQVSHQVRVDNYLIIALKMHQ